MKTLLTVLCTLILCPCSVAGAISPGTGWKLGVTIGTTFAALVFLAIAGFLFYYFFVRKWLRQSHPGEQKAAVYQVSNTAVKQNNQQHYEKHRSQAVEYAVKHGDYDKEPTGGGLNHSIITTSSYNSYGQNQSLNGPESAVVQQVEDFSPSHQSRIYQQTVQSASVNRSPAAYVGSSV